MSTRGLSIPIELGGTIVPLHGKTGNNTFQEDSPSNPSAAVVHDMHNVLPTAKGYRSAFQPLIPYDVAAVAYNDPEDFHLLKPEYTEARRAANALKQSRVQKVIPYETRSQDLIYICLTEEGIFLHNPCESVLQGEVYRMIAVDSSPNDGLLHLWTTAIVDDRLFCFRQGSPYIYILGDGTLPAYLDNRKVAYDVIHRTEDELTYLVTATPSFLNMEGQVGIFSLNNRLGFWDSENSVSWSSIYNKLDFVPDETTGAGTTTFSGVLGTIVSVLPTPTGFIIYGSGSIVNVVPMDGAERWKANTLLKEDGIRYATHAATGINYNIHFALTSAGMYMISQGSAKQVLVEETRHLLERDELLMLTVIGEDYLLISVCNEWEESPAILNRQVARFKTEDGYYNFFIPKKPIGQPTNPWVDILLDWDDPLTELTEDDYELEEPIVQDADKPYVPCWSGYSFVGPSQFKIDSLSGTWDNDSAIPVPEFRDYYYPNISWTRLPTVGLMGYFATDCIYVPNEGAETLSVPTVTPWFVKDVEWKSRPPVGYDNDAFLDIPPDELMERIIDAHTRYAGYQEAFYGVNSTLMANLPDIYDRRTKCAAPVPNILAPSGAATGWEFKGFTLDDWSEEPNPPITLPKDVTLLLTQFSAVVAEIEALKANIEGTKLILKRIPEDERKPYIETLNTLEAELVEAQAAKEAIEEEGEEAVKYIINGEEFPYPNIVKITNPDVYKEVPAFGVSPVTTVDDCGVKVYGYIDDIVGVGVWFPRVIPYEKAPRQCGHESIVRDGDPNKPCVCSASSLSGPTCINIETGEYYVCGTDYGLGVYDCTDEYLPNAIIGSICQFFPETGITCARLGIGQAIETKFYFFPKSFIGKTFAELADLMTPKTITTNPCWVKIFEAEKSGFGYYEDFGSAGQSFRKSISKRISIFNREGECQPTEDPEVITGLPEDWEDFYESGGEDWNSPTIPDGGIIDRYPENWNYPEVPEWKMPIDHEYTGYLRKGTISPYYPSYYKTWVYDLQLEKWGSLDYPVGVVFPTRAINGSRAVADNQSGLLPFGIVPRFVPPPKEAGYYDWANRLADYLRLAPIALVKMHELPTFLFPYGNAGKLDIGSIALTRDGVTKLVGISGAEMRHGAFEVRGSFSGQSFGSIGNVDWVYPYEQAAYYNTRTFKKVYDESDEYSGESQNAEFNLPFVLIGKEFEIGISGNFNIHRLFCYGQATGRIEFHGGSPVQVIWD